MDRQMLQALRDLPIEGVAERLGLEVRRHTALCPFHNDHHPSLSFNVRKNTFRCFVCDAHGGTIDLVMRTLHKDFKEACEWLGNDGLRCTVYSLPAPSEERPFDASRYERFFERPYLSPEARHFLFEERRLDERVVRWCRLSSWRDRQGVNWLQIPYYDCEGNLTGIQNRNLSNLCSTLVDSLHSDLSSGARRHTSQDRASCGAKQNNNDNVCSTSVADHVSCGARQNNNTQPRFKFPRGSQCGIYNLPILNRLHEGEELWITEGASDCWAMLSAGHKAIAIPSATLLKPKDVRLLETLNWELETPFHMFPDHDEPGERLFLQLQQVLPNLEHHQLPLGCKDYSDYYIKMKNEK